MKYKIIKHTGHDDTSFYTIEVDGSFFWIFKTEQEARDYIKSRQAPVKKMIAEGDWL